MSRGKRLKNYVKKEIIKDYTDPKSLCYENVSGLATKYEISGASAYKVLHEFGIKRAMPKPVRKEIESTQISPETTILNIPFPLKRVVIRFDSTEIVLEG